MARSIFRECRAGRRALGNFCCLKGGRLSSLRDSAAAERVAGSFGQAASLTSIATDRLSLRFAHSIGAALRDRWRSETRNYRGAGLSNVKPMTRLRTPASGQRWSPTLRHGERMSPSQLADRLRAAVHRRLVYEGRRTHRPMHRCKAHGCSLERRRATKPDNASALEHPGWIAPQSTS